MPPARFREIAQTAEGLGFDLILFPDHIVMEGPERQMDPHALAYDHIAVAAALMEATKKIRIGHLVLCNLFRHPAITAQSLMTLDHLSNGRLIAGLGTGWTETEFRMTGISFPPIAERLRMLDEALTCIRSLWSNEQTNFDGEFYHLKDAILWPKPIQKPYPPILLGGGGKGLLRIAAKHADIVNIISEAGKMGHISLEYIRKMTTDAFREKADFVRAEAKKHGRNPAAIRLSNAIFAPTVTETREEGRQAAEMMAQMFGMSVDAVRQSPLALIGTPDECVVELKRRAKEWDVTQFIFSGPIGQDEKGLRRLREDILAHV
ncbi:MAG: LLM class flavin-dependent oxidoreductase [Candidatus Binatus sp.]|uniref:LLM class flavin-dependent oxidoreductase n=1 Tax=Candidatus Binatus sp. TaxID=2811406 RepID=UPI002717375A|nr:LLM class flavin-dependent oxidoreductase [Candidatus Binatus sp.]MDO8432246.1 LLM class flavin-dependent oxidoreductase [Candidatus Binatus sp.]